MPHLKCDADAVEKVQRRFTKRIRGLGNYSYIQRLTHLRLPIDLKLDVSKMTSFGATKYFLDMPKSVRKIFSNFDLAVHVVTLINYLSDIAAEQ